VEDIGGEVMVPTGDQRLGAGDAVAARGILMCFGLDLQRTEVTRSGHKGGKRPRSDRIPLEAQ
jgi:hypothetical protein